MKAYTVLSSGVEEGLVPTRGSYASYVRCGMVKDDDGELRSIGALVGDRDFSLATEAIFECHPVRTTRGVILVASDPNRPSDHGLVHLDVNPGVNGSIEITDYESKSQPCPNREKDLKLVGPCPLCSERVERIHPNKGETAKLPSPFPSKGIAVLLEGKKKHRDDPEGRYVLYPSMLLEMEPGSAFRVYTWGRGEHLIRFVRWDGNSLQMGSYEEIFLPSMSINGTNGQASKPDKKSRKAVAV